MAFAGVISRGSRDAARRLVREHGWRFPIAFDRDGGVANRYGVLGCPEAVLALPGGEIHAILRGRSAEDIGRPLAALEAAARRAGRSR